VYVTSAEYTKLEFYRLALKTDICKTVSTTKLMYTKLYKTKC
jgi:hypothetical protein